MNIVGRIVEGKNPILIGGLLVVISLWMLSSIPVVETNREFDFNWIERPIVVREMENKRITRISACLGENECAVFVLWSEIENNVLECIKFVWGYDLTNIPSENKDYLEIEDPDFSTHSQCEDMENYWVVLLDKIEKQDRVDRLIKLGCSSGPECRNCLKSESILVGNYPNYVYNPGLAMIKEGSKKRLTVFFIEKIPKEISKTDDNQDYLYNAWYMACDMIMDPGCLNPIEKLSIGSWETRVSNLIFFQDTSGGTTRYFRCYSNVLDQIYVEFSNSPTFEVGSDRQSIVLSDNGKEVRTQSFWITPHNDQENVFIISYITEDDYGDTGINIGYFLLDKERYEDGEQIEVHEEDWSMDVRYPNKGSWGLVSLNRDSDVHLVQDDNGWFWIFWNAIIFKSQRSSIVAAKIRYDPKPQDQNTIHLVLIYILQLNSFLLLIYGVVNGFLRWRDVDKNLSHAILFSSCIIVLLIVVLAFPLVFPQFQDLYYVPEPIAIVTCIIGIIATLIIASYLRKQPSNPTELPPQTQ